jgi:hypothetical protein
MRYPGVQRAVVVNRYAAGRKKLVTVRNQNFHYFLGNERK